jgi:hypothetical protein
MPPRGRHTETLPTDLEEAIRRAFVEPPSQATADRHLAMLMSAGAQAPSRTQPAAGGRRVLASPRLRLGIAVVAVVLALPVTFAGLAAAGVRLPDAVDSAFETAGIELPNQLPDGADEETGREAEPDSGPKDAARSEDESSSQADSGGDRGGRVAESKSSGNGSSAEPSEGNRPAGRPPEAEGAGAGDGSNGPPANAQGGQTGAPPHSQQGGQGAGDPPSHAQDGAGGPPPHSQSGGSQQSESAEAAMPSPQSKPMSPAADLGEPG